MEFKLQLADKRGFDHIQTQPMSPVNIFDFLDVIRKKPNFYLQNQKSLRMLECFLGGFECGLLYSGGAEGIFGQLRDFNQWVAKELGFGESASGWCTMIVSKAGSDEKAYDLFFELLDKYRQDHGLMS